MRCVAIRHETSMHIRGRIVTDRNAKHEKRIRVGRVLLQPIAKRGELLKSFFKLAEVKSIQSCRHLRTEKNVLLCI